MYRKEIVQDLLQDLVEVQDAAAQLPLLLMVQDDAGRPVSFVEHLLLDVGQVSNRPDSSECAQLSRTALCRLAFCERRRCIVI